MNFNVRNGTAALSIKVIYYPGILPWSHWLSQETLLWSMGVGGASCVPGMGQSAVDQEEQKHLKEGVKAALIRSSTAYRIVSRAALWVLTSTMPIYYKAELRTEIFELNKMYQREHDESRSRAGIAENFVKRMRAVKERIDGNEGRRMNGVCTEKIIGRRS